MTIKELRARLAEYPEDLEVYYPDFTAVQPYRLTDMKVVSLVKNLTFLLLS